MNQPVPYEPRRFQSAVPYYERYRLGYPERLIARVVALLGLKQGDAVLDLGCGPGSLSVPFARVGMTVTAADPEPEMLAAAEAAAEAAGVTLKFWRGGSYDLKPDIGPYRLVTIGRAFHWMDRMATLTMLDKIVGPGGAVAFFHDAHPVLPENDWFKLLCKVGDRYGRSAQPHIVERKALGHRRYEPFLYQSAFTELDGLSVTIRKAITMDDIVGRAFSQSTTSPEKLGARGDAFEAELRERLRELSPDGAFTEIAEMVALVARRKTQ
ncbi:MAG TPA: class I SAM-dependent methyltransferase [Rhizomicrobium sp.]|nr:class I SAM-dependent methyltransferase [Rhizomicrobium sp.]